MDPVVGRSQLSRRPHFKHFVCLRGTPPPACIPIIVWRNRRDASSVYSFLSPVNGSCLQPAFLLQTLSPSLCVCTCASSVHSVLIVVASRSRIPSRTECASNMHSVSIIVRHINALPLSRCAVPPTCIPFDRRQTHAHAVYSGSLPSNMHSVLIVVRLGSDIPDDPLRGPPTCIPF